VARLGPDAPTLRAASATERESEVHSDAR